MEDAWKPSTLDALSLYFHAPKIIVSLLTGLTFDGRSFSLSFPPCRWPAQTAAYQSAPCTARITTASCSTALDVASNIIPSILALAGALIFQYALGRATERQRERETPYPEHDDSAAARIYPWHKTSIAGSPRVQHALGFGRRKQPVVAIQYLPSTAAQSFADFVANRT